MNAKKRFSEKVRKTANFLEHDLWKIPTEELSRRHSYLIRQLRVIVLAIRGFNEDHVAMRASALTYFTLFSIVPIFGLVFGIAKGFGMETYLELQLEVALAGRQEVHDWIVGFSQSMLQNVRGGVVAGIGLLILLYTIMNLLDNMEKSFNQIWQVNKPRPWSRKFSDYFSIMFLAPLFFILSSAATVYLNTQLADIPPGVISRGLVFIVGLIPYMLIWIMLTLLYMIMPYTNVRLGPALIAGIIAGTLFQLVQWGYIHFQIGVSRYNAIYGSFAALPLLLMWIQVSWLVILLGAELSYAFQNVDNYAFDIESRKISPYTRKLLAVYIMQMLVMNFVKGLRPASSGEIAYELVIPNKLVRSILNELVAAGLLSEIRTDQHREFAYQPAIDVNQISVRMVLDKLDHLGDEVAFTKPTPQLRTIIDSMNSFAASIDTSGKNILLKNIR